MRHPRWPAVAVWSVAGLAALATTISSPASAVGPLIDTAPSPACIAHRGNVDSPSHTEETLGAYTDAIAAGIPEVEGDIRWTKSKYPVLIHNPDLGLFGAPTVDVADVTVGQLQDHESPSGDAVPTLYQVRQLMIQHPATRWELELKEEPANWDTLDARLGDLKSRVTLASFDLARLRRAQDRGYATVYLTALDTTTTAAPVVAQSWSQVDTTTSARNKAVGIETYTYTPDSLVAWKMAKDRGATRMITNKPLACSDFMEGQ